MKIEDKSQQTLFTQQWNIYQKVIRNNYMYHAEIIDIVSSEIGKFSSLSILDLGCGDAYIVSQSIKNINDRNKQIDYRGVDLSPAALEIGKTNLQSLNGNIQLINNDLLSELQTDQHSYDIILLGYSLHHLNTQQKQQCFSLISRHLSNQGVFIFYDLEMTADENQPAYIKRACDVFTEQWHDFDDAAISSICSHVIDNDLPENEHFYKKCFGQAGFSVIKRMFSDRHQLFSLYVVNNH